MNDPEVDRIESRLFFEGNTFHFGHVRLSMFGSSVYGEFFLTKYQVSCQGLIWEWRRVN